ncbi:MAG: Tn3 family transposase [Lentisphaeria bacterium]|nr:Tn3 family transposase [Lentisphaeria bacterium]NQZ66750.1 Tn3 family transposase [Lentisphaeria bacterium]
MRPSTIVIFTVLENPDSKIRDALYPVVSESIFRDLVREFEASSPSYIEQVQHVARNSFKSHYRRMMSPLINALIFRCNNQHHRPIINAVNTLKSLDSNQRILSVDNLPVEGIVPKSLQLLLIEDEKINRISYEICVLKALRNGLRCREIWVKGARRYRNPDEDIPEDFEEKRNTYYDELKLPENSEDFIQNLQSRMEIALRTLDTGLSKNNDVSIRQHGKNLIKVSPLVPQVEPSFLKHLKSKVMVQWPMTSLLDILKEADYQIDFTSILKSYGDREILTRDVLQKRLLLCLYALGTNTGIKRVLAGGEEVTQDELRYVKERYIHKPSLKAAIAKVVNATLQVRQSQVWGELWIALNAM